MGRDLMDSLNAGHTSIEMDRMGSRAPPHNNREYRSPGNDYPRRPRAPPAAHTNGHYNNRPGLRPSQRPRANSSANFPEFNQKVDRIHKGIERVNAQIDEVKRAHEETLNTTGDFRLSKCTARRDEQISAAQTLVSQVKDEMKALRELKNHYMSSPKVANSQKMMLQAKYQGVGQDVKNLLLTYSQVAKGYSMQYREKLKKQYRIANPDATEEEVDEAVYNDDAHQAFATAVSKSSKNINATRVLSSVKQRHDDVKKIEKTIEELAALISELAELVDEQQLQLDNIEDAVEASSTYVREGHEQIGQAIVLKKKSNKKKWWCILVFIIALIVIGVALYFKLKK